MREPTVAAIISLAVVGFVGGIGIAMAIQHRIDDDNYRPLRLALAATPEGNRMSNEAQKASEPSTLEKLRNNFSQQENALDRLNMQLEQRLKGARRCLRGPEPEKAAEAMPAPKPPSDRCIQDLQAAIDKKLSVANVLVDELREFLP